MVSSLDYERSKHGGLIMTREDCIYFEEKEESTGWNHCKRSCSLDNEGHLCDICRLWDSYIPKNSFPGEIERAKRWQDMPLDEQPDYEDYF